MFEPVSLSRLFCTGVGIVVDLKVNHWKGRQKRHSQNSVCETFAFDKVGVDYCVPLLIKTEDGESMKKTWVCLFTCTASRAVHLELVTDLTPEDFLRCLSRFCSRRGKPSVIISDNLSTFTASRKIFIKLFSTKEVQSYLASKNIKWKLLLGKAPWQGGFFERLIGTVKQTLKKVLGGARLNYEELLTVLNDIECTINCRPITHMSTDENIEPLCPSQLITGRRILSLPGIADWECADEVVSQESLTKRMKYVNSLLQHYWRRWS